MFEWLQFIGEFLLAIVEGVPVLLSMFADANALFYSAFVTAPSFLVPILLLSVAAVIVMWVVNIF